VVHLQSTVKDGRIRVTIKWRRSGDVKLPILEYSQITSPPTTVDELFVLAVTRVSSLGSQDFMMESVFVEEQTPSPLRLRYKLSQSPIQFCYLAVDRIWRTSTRLCRQCDLETLFSASYSTLRPTILGRDETSSVNIYIGIKDPLRAPSRTFKIHRQAELYEKQYLLVEVG
jgi:hypothetical protein